MPFPIQRLRRLRKTKSLRFLTQETRLAPSDFILPLFVAEGLKKPETIDSMPGVLQHSLDSLVREAGLAHSLGVPAVVLFGVPRKKDSLASEAYRPEGIVQKAVRRIKKEIPSLIVITDVCACEYTSHGHCGILEKGEVANDPTLTLLQKIALSHAQAGSDMVAPSDMMDGRVAAIRKILDKNHFKDTPILSYAAKFASVFYGPFRDAAGSSPSFGDRKSYQMNGANIREALREIELDVEEGADLVMVKPALSALDVIAKARARFDLPIWTYQVSGEYSMIKAAAQKKWLDEEGAMVESLTAMKRAGADRILTYWAKEAARFFKKEQA